MSRQQNDVDILFDVKNSYYIGNFQQCINEAQKIKPPTPELQLERDVFLYRSYIAQKKYRVVLDEINASSPSELQPLKMLADYFANKGRRDSIVTALDGQVNNSSSLQNHMFVIAAAMIYCHEKSYEAALRVLHSDDHLENLAMNLQIYLRMDRVDLARKELKAMQEKDEDNTLSQLAQAWLNISMGGDKLQDAYYIFQELIDKYGSSAVLLNGQAVTCIGQGKWDEAEGSLQEAMDKDANCPDVLINTMVLTQLGNSSKPIEVANRYQSQLKDSHADHIFITDYAKKESEFDALARRFSVAV
ncbi:hypothetical protein AAG570_004014 [Ranatra chinensis]|uniref:Coatomer subunit epsilon n=1 Tax=Ranatra chinensis TaxID=642074 RepID=A0ABD0Y2K5_9HEMI